MPTEKTRKKIVASFIKLLDANAYEAVGYEQIAEEAGVGLDVVRASYASKEEMLGAFISEIDQKVLSEAREDIAEEGSRDRLFDVLMSRLDALEPYRGALHNIEAAMSGDPVLRLALLGMISRSMDWMMVAAAINETGLRRAGMSRALAVGFGRVISVWLDETDPGQPKTMVALDDMLKEGQRWMGRVEKAQKLAGPFVKRLFGRKRA
ncbi:TetR/AcrR family transcriptional regulator [Rhodobacteraceae bacterium RKSG542]|uniref:TetR/AcrR family transcriptional regulator n=1 Tax=Pseudovibrio flavus TaxID=2529854 RepID=UPI0012BC4BF1|nr:TetR/AcrR family transcriptional regulator [Pseudovibrio flavus]MTI19030.1 TetR/AcrR family transcriptional regulator [Pseudovibrio flavus]